MRGGLLYLQVLYKDEGVSKEQLTFASIVDLNIIVFTISGKSVYFFQCRYFSITSINI
jgi:hypothetical protein